MAITNPQAINFTELARKVAALKLRDYYTSITLNDLWNGQNMSSLITNDSSVVQDGAGSSNGMPVATGAAVTNIVTRCQDTITDMTANSNAKLNTLLAIVADAHQSEI